MLTDAGNKVVELKKGSVLYNQGEECSTMYLLKRGRVALYLNYGTPNQHELLVEEGLGSSLGEMGLLQGEARNATAVALEDSELVEIDEAHFEAFVGAHPELAIRMIKDLSLRFSRLTDDFDSTKELLLKTLTESERRSLKGRLKRLADILLDIPEDVPPDLYIECYIRNHGNMI